MITIISVTGDLIRFWALVYLIYQIYNHKVSHIISLKSQVVVLISFAVRYNISGYIYYQDQYDPYLYLNFMKTMLLILQIIVVVLIIKNRCSRERQSIQLYEDTFQWKYFLIAAITINFLFSRFEMLWGFSFALESIAQLPQIMLLVKYELKNERILRYLYAIAISKIIYVIGWIIYESLQPMNRRYVIFEILGYLPLLRIIVRQNKYKFKQPILI